MRIPVPTRLALVGVVLLVALPVTLDAASRYPDWAIVGERRIDVPVGAASVAGRFGFNLGAYTGTVTLGYDGKGKITGGGSSGEFGSYLFRVDGTWDVDAATGRPHIRFADAKKNPKFSFEGVMRADLKAIEGTYATAPGFAYGEDSASGPLSLGRTPPAASSEMFELRFDSIQDLHGKIKTARVNVVGAKAPLSEATLLIFGNELLDRGRVSGRLRTQKDGTTTARLRVKGRHWSVTMTGPVDEAGFHATAALRSPIWDATDIALTLPVVAGPEEPPPPPPPAPKNLLDGAVARVAGGLVTITREDAPAKHFGKKADLTVQFPSDVGRSTVHATPATAGGQTPTRFYFDQHAGKTYGTATAPADVQIVVEEISLSVGGTIQLHATGETYTPEGRRVIVDVILLARVAP